MKTKLLFLVVFLFFYSCSIFPQFAYTIKKKSITKLDIKNEKLLPILDTMILLEKKCKYYNDSLCFTIFINSRTNTNFESIQIESTNDFFSVFEFFEPILGYFHYNNHLFFVYNLTKYERFFLKTNKTKTFYYKQYKANSLIVIDDSHTYCTFDIIDDNFVNKSLSYPCDK